VSVDPETQRIDLHTHSNCSDGTLSPTELVALAATRSVQLLALTDHDTMAGCDAAAAACQPLGIRFVPGIELTCGWREREIHVVGLDVDASSAGLTAHTADLLLQRRARIVEIGRRLSRHGLNGEALAERALADAVAPTRMHVARLLTEQGVVATPQQAFDRLLGRGKPGYAPTQWPSVEQTVQCINAAGGVAVLAHPHRYQFSHGALRELCAHFKAVGGAGIEVSLAGLSPADFARLASLARRFGLAGSVGSDFHEPGIPWRPLGRFAKLPDLVTPITLRLVA
jgi:3',5'-nucleoside bisphosphate phosphatase